MKIVHWTCFQRPQESRLWCLLLNVCPCIKSLCDPSQQHLLVLWLSTTRKWWETSATQGLSFIHSCKLSKAGESHSDTHTPTISALDLLLTLWGNGWLNGWRLKQGQLQSTLVREHTEKSITERCYKEEQKGGDTPVMSQEAPPCGDTMHYNSNCYNTQHTVTR